MVIQNPMENWNPVSKTMQIILCLARGNIYSAYNADISLNIMTLKSLYRIFYVLDENYCHI